MHFHHPYVDTHLANRCVTSCESHPINVQNKKFDNGESNFEGELHPWDDLTEEEFLHQYTGLIEEEEDRDLERANNLRSINHLSRLKKKYSQLEIPEFWDSRDPALTNSPSGLWGGHRQCDDTLARLPRSL